MATDISIRELVVQYGKKRALDSVSLDCPPGGLTAIVGPSGCGKTTLLRTVAGFLPAASGEIHFGATEVTRLSPQRRKAGMVFQNYALWPHLSVFANVAYGLKIQGVDRVERERRVIEVLERVEIPVDDVRSKHPQEYSGGQQQRIALARALVTRPDVLLLDEPLSSLDAQVRTRLRDEIRDVQQSFGITAIYVTHDQEEALAMADQVVVMRDGRVEQVGSPEDIYAAPASPFVARFLGDTSELTVDNDPGAAYFVRAGDVRMAPSEDAGLTWERAADGALRGSGVVLKHQYLGASYRYTVRVGTSADPANAATDQGTQLLVVEAPARLTASEVRVEVPPAAVHRFGEGE